MTGADSAGQPWEGRSFSHHDDAYANDDGSMPAAFETAMRELQGRGFDLVPVITALRDARLLVPLVAEAGGVQEQEGRTVEKSQELSIVTVAGPDGAPILPMFSNTEAMRQWRADARPVPASMQRAAAAALEDGTSRIIIDPGSWSEIVLTRSMLEALLQGSEWTPLPKHPTVIRELIGPLLGLQGIAAVVASSGDPLSKLAGRSLEIRVIFHDSVDRDEAQRSFEETAGNIGKRQNEWIDLVRDIAFQVVWMAGPARISASPGSEIYTPKG